MLGSYGNKDHKYASNAHPVAPYMGSGYNYGDSSYDPYPNYGMGITYY